MIIGIGTDLLDTRRIERTLKQYNQRFIERVFTELEMKKAIRRISPANVYAMNFAAKEACSKALGTGIRQGVFWKDLGVYNLPSGKPYMILTGGAKTRLNSLTPAGMTSQIDISLTDEYPMAHAMVIISAVTAA